MVQFVSINLGRGQPCSDPVARTADKLTKFKAETSEIVFMHLWESVTETLLSIDIRIVDQL